MKNFVREYPGVSLCGLNCRLCTMHIGGYCPGCGGGAGNQGCPIARCAMQMRVEFCCFCKEYPCAKYDGIDAADSFITHLKQKDTLEKIRRIGVLAYRNEIEEKAAILALLLAQYNDGRRKSLFSAAANLLELPMLRQIAKRLAVETASMTTAKERAAAAAGLLHEAAGAQGISFTLRKKK